MTKKNIVHGWKDRQKPTLVECSVCGQPMKPGMDDCVEVCRDCSGAKKSRLLPDKSETIDRDEDDDDERAEFRDAWSSMREEWGAE